jgi:hypothetical protein
MCSARIFKAACPLIGFSCSFPFTNAVSLWLYQVSVVWHAPFTIKNRGRIQCVKYWEIIADNLKRAVWSWGCVSAIDSNGRTIWIADAHCGDGKRFLCVLMNFA